MNLFLIFFMLPLLLSFWIHNIIFSAAEAPTLKISVRLTWFHRLTLKLYFFFFTRCVPTSLSRTYPFDSLCKNKRVNDVGSMCDGKARANIFCMEIKFNAENPQVVWSDDSLLLFVQCSLKERDFFYTKCNHLCSLHFFILNLIFYESK